MASVNKAVLVGRLGKDPVLRNTQGGTSVTSFSMATSEKYKDKSGVQQERTEWHNITCWGKLADIVAQYCKKGSMVYVEGKIQTDSYEKDGIKRYKTEIIAKEIQFLDSKSSNMQSQNNATQPPALPDDSSDLPF